MSRKHKRQADKDNGHSFGDEAPEVNPQADSLAEAADAASSLAEDAVETATEAVADPVRLDPVEELRKERDDLKDKLLRLAAEFDNHRKRTAREWQELRKRAAGEVLREVLEVVDNLERALEANQTDADGLRKGVELTHQQALDALKKFGIEIVEARGEPFDPNCHEAVLMVDTEEVESEHVVDVVQRGYSLHGEILRPARVTVSR